MTDQSSSVPTSQQYDTDSEDNNSGVSKDSNQERKYSVTNPEVVMKLIHQEWCSLYADVGQVYKFEHPKSKLKLQLGSIIHTINNFISFKWTLWYKNKGGATIIPYRYTQEVIAFVRYQEHNPPTLTLRNKSNTNLIKEIVQGFANQGVIAEKVANTEKEKADIMKRNEELRLKAEALHQENVRRERAEQERKRLPPLIQPPSFDDQDYINEPNMGLGGVSLSDLRNRTDDNEQEELDATNLNNNSGNNSSNPASGLRKADELNDDEKLKKEWSNKGKQAYKNDHIHAQIWEFYTRIAQYFAPVRACLVPDDPKSKAPKYKIKLHSTVFVVNDVEYDFVNSFATLNSLNRFIVHVFPLSFAASQSTLHIRSFDTGTLVEIEHPQYFSFLGEVKNKPDCGFVFHCTTIAQKETSVHFEIFINSQDEKFVKGLAADIWKYRGGLANNDANSAVEQEVDAQLSNTASAVLGAVDVTGFVRAQAGLALLTVNEQLDQLALAQNEIDLLDVQVVEEEEDDDLF